MRRALLLLILMSLLGPSSLRAQEEDPSPDRRPYEDPEVTEEPEPLLEDFPRFDLLPSWWATWGRFDLKAGPRGRTRSIDENELRLQERQSAMRLDVKARFHELFGVAGGLFYTRYFGDGELDGDLIFDDTFFPAGTGVDSKVAYLGGFAEFELFLWEESSLRLGLPLGARYTSIRTRIRAPGLFGLRTDERTASIFIPSVGIDLRWQPGTWFEVNLSGRLAFLAGIGESRALTGEIKATVDIALWPDTVYLSLGGLYTGGFMRFFSRDKRYVEQVRWHVGGPLVGLRLRY